jgi:hypothetical protein
MTDRLALLTQLYVTRMQVLFALPPLQAQRDLKDWMIHEKVENASFADMIVGMAQKDLATIERANFMSAVTEADLIAMDKHAVREHVRLAYNALSDNNLGECHSRLSMVRDLLGDLEP